MNFGRFKKLHFVGIGGSGMSGIAEVLHNMGFKITGSDLKKTAVTERLESLGIPINYGHRPENIDDADVVVISTAVPDDNPEVVAARELKIPVIRRADMLAELMRMKYSVAVSGAHGKTTTTSMIAKVLEDAGLDPTIVVGGRIKGLGTGAKLGSSEYLVAEADESDKSFLKLFPTIAVITNIDEEHLDTYKNFDAIKDAFVQFAERVPFYGLVTLNLDDPGARSILPRINKRIMTYGLSRQADVHARDVQIEGMTSRYRAYYREHFLASVELQVPGIHNIKNSLSAFVVGIELEIPPDIVAKALSSFTGVMRRFEIKGERDGVKVVDDYGHHPSEIAAVLQSARRYWDGRIIVVFQPHRYTRTYYLHRKFGPVFNDADKVIVMPIYPAGEKPIEGVSAELICKAIRDSGHRDVTLVSGHEEALQLLRETAKEGDLVITLGAGDVWKVGEEFLKGK